MEQIKRLALNGPILGILAALLFGISTPAIKWLAPLQNPWLTAGFLYLGAGIGLSLTYWLWIGVRNNKEKSKQEGFQRSDWKWLVLLTFFGGLCAPLFMMFGLSQTTASSASLLLNCESVLTALIAWFLFREHFSKRILWGMIAIVLGGILMASDGQFHIDKNLTGPFLILAACLFWAIDNNLTRKISSNNPVIITIIKSCSAGIVNIALALSFSGFQDGQAIPGMASLFVISAVGFVCYGVSLVFYTLSLRLVGTSRTAAYFSLAPFIGAAAAIIFLGEPCTFIFVVSAMLMAFGVCLHLTEQHEHQHEHAPMEHSHQHIHDEHHQHRHDRDEPIDEPHSHRHMHESLNHSHPHFPDIHHRHDHIMIKDWARQLKTNLAVIRCAYANARTPWYAKAIAVAVVAYAVSPIDLIPDFIPILGYLDDLVIVPLGIALALKLIPGEVLASCRRKVRRRSRCAGYRT